MDSQTAPEQKQIRSLANAIRALSMDAVQAAKSGHPGMPMGMADVATVLYRHFLKFDAADPNWPDRDRFVLSAGHGSMLLYSLLYLTGTGPITIDNIKRFRQIDSPCAGHPEYGHLPGVETTTGPLGQGIATAVGMAIAERHLSARFGSDLVDHKTYVLASDGDLMEGISHEAISLAGHLKLGKLIVLWDDNQISIDGPISLADSTDMAMRFKAAGWATDTCDGHDATDIFRALKAAQNSDRPVLIACRTKIGFGSPNKEGTSKAHGEALGEDEIKLTREKLGWPYEAFVVPNELMDEWRSIGAKGKDAHASWRKSKRSNVKSAEFDKILACEIPAGFDDAIKALKTKFAREKAMASRKASELTLEVINDTLPFTIGGSADLTPSNNTKTKITGDITPTDFSGRYMRYGIREHGMAAAMNGMALHGGVLPYGGTFLIFSDYCKPAIRLSALMGTHVVYVMTHDSIGLGEDGPTHEPVEQIAGLRAMPNLHVFRPADAVETAECWQIAVKDQKRPSLLALSRQNLAPVRTENLDENLSAKGAYELLPATGKAQVTLLATGSEVEIAVEARTALEAGGIGTRVVSMPCWSLFDEQSPEYQEKTLGPQTVKVGIEAASPLGWDRYIGPSGKFVGMRSFGASAPYKDVYQHFGITAEAVAEAARDALKKKG